MVARGEVWWHEAPDEGRRPHLVLTRDEGIPLLTHLIAVPATRTIRTIPSEVLLDERDGMHIECVLSLDNIRVVRRAHLTERITMLTPARLRQVCDALDFAIDC